MLILNESLIPSPEIAVMSDDSAYDDHEGAFQFLEPKDFEMANKLDENWAGGATRYDPETMMKYYQGDMMLPSRQPSGKPEPVSSKSV